MKQQGDRILESEARNWAFTLTELLNTTVTHGVKLSSGLHNTECHVSCRASQDILDVQPIRVTLGNKKPSCYLDLVYRLILDDEGEHLAVAKSHIAVCVDQGLDDTLFRYDYSRAPAKALGHDPPLEYPAAHVHIYADSEHYPRDTQKMHFPVGGRRFRPSLEDIIEFLVVENIAEPRPGWSDALEESRQVWYRRQLRAAVRRDPETAAGQLKQEGYTVGHPG